MKTTILSGLFLIFVSLSGAGQNTDKQTYSVTAENDSITAKQGAIHISFPDNNDSFKLKDKSALSVNKKDDLLVFNPGPSLDRMPNAIVTTPGVHYHLKIIPDQMALKNKQLLPWEYKMPPLQPLQPWKKKLQPWEKDLQPWEKDLLPLNRK